MSAIICGAFYYLQKIENLNRFDNSRKVLIDDSRLGLWKDSIKIFKDNPWLGSGLGTFKDVYGKYASVNTTFYKADYAHNEYLQYLSDNGIFAMLVLLMVLFIAGRFVYKNYYKRRSRHFKAVGLGAAAGCVAFLIHSFFEFNFKIPANLFLFSFMLSVATGALTTKQRGEKYEYVMRKRHLKVISLWPITYFLMLFVSTLTLATISIRLDSAKKYLIESRALPNNAAIEKLKNAVSVNPLDVSVLQELASRLISTRKYDEAQNYLEKAEKLNTYDPYVYYYSSVVQKTMKKVDVAIDLIKKAVEKDGMNGRWHKIAGDYYLENGNIAEAVIFYSSALRLAPVYAEDIFKKYLSSSGDILLARTMIPPGNDHVTFELVKALGANKRYKEAYELFTDKMQDSGVHGNYFRSFSQILIKGRQYDLIKKLFLKTDVKKLDPYLKCDYGLALYKIGKREQGVNILLGSFKSDITNTKGLNTIFDLLRSEKKYDELKRILDGLSKDYPSNGHVDYLYSKYCRIFKKWYAALEKAKSSVSKSPLNVIYRQNLGFLYYELNMYKEAINEWKKILDINSKAEWVKKDIAKAYGKIGMDEESGKWLK